MGTKTANGINSQKSEDGEELMVSFLIFHSRAIESIENAHKLSSPGVDRKAM